MHQIVLFFFIRPPHGVSGPRGPAWPAKASGSPHHRPRTAPPQDSSAACGRAAWRCASGDMPTSSDARPPPGPSHRDPSWWHQGNTRNDYRRPPISLPRAESLHTTIKNYFGIDLVPWHTKNVKYLNGYLEENFLAIQLWSLNFAIQASKQAKGLFANKVIVRTNLATFKELFKNEFDSGFFIEDIKLPIIKKKNNDNFQKIKIKNEKDVEIYLLWGMRNSLPTESFLKEIFKPRMETKWRLCNKRKPKSSWPLWETNCSSKTYQDWPIQGLTGWNRQILSFSHWYNQ